MNVLILGSKSDVGVACANEFAANGANLHLACRNLDKNSERIAGDLELRHKVKVMTHQFDALDYASHESVLDSIAEPIDIVVSVFGVLGDHKEAIKDFAYSRNIIETNFLGNVSILGLIANRMEQEGVGVIACVSSVAGERGRMSNYVYGSSKAGLTAFLSGLRNRLAHTGVHVLSVKPGFIRTKMIEGLEPPNILTATAEEVGKAIYKGCVKKKNVVYVKSIWRWIMLIIKSIPEPIFKKLKL